MGPDFDIQAFVGYTQPEEFDVKEEVIEETGDYIIKAIELRTQIDTSIEAYLVLPVNYIITPGIHFIHWLETHANNSNRDEFLPMARKLATEGMSSILPNCFWSLDKDTFEVDPQQYTRNWWNTTEDHDKELIRSQLIELKTVEDYFLQLPGIDQDRTILAAHDFGAMFGILLSRLGHSYAGYAMMAFTSHWSDWFRFGSKLEEEDLQPYISALDPLAPINHISKITRPVFLLFAKDDFYVPLDRVSAIYQATPEPKLVSYYDADHGMNEDAFADMENWIRNLLKDKIPTQPSK